MLGRLVTAAPRRVLVVSGLAPVLVDATVIRGVLVPAAMALAGSANRWAPAPLRRLHERIGLREEAGRLQAAGIRGA